LYRGKTTSGLPGKVETLAESEIRVCVRSFLQGVLGRCLGREWPAYSGVVDRMSGKKSLSVEKGPVNCVGSRTAFRVYKHPSPTLALNSLHLEGPSEFSGKRRFPFRPATPVPYLQPVSGPCGIHPKLPGLLDLPQWQGRRSVTQ
jgi:hypothetical protein